MLDLDVREPDPARVAALALWLTRLLASAGLRLDEAATAGSSAGGTAGAHRSGASSSSSPSATGAGWREVAVLVFVSEAVVHRHYTGRKRCFQCVRLVWPDVFVDDRTDAVLWLHLQRSLADIAKPKSVSMCGGSSPAALRGHAAKPVDGRGSAAPAAAAAVAARATQGRPACGQPLPFRACRREGLSHLEDSPERAPAVLLPPLLPSLLVRVAIGTARAASAVGDAEAPPTASKSGSSGSSSAGGGQEVLGLLGTRPPSCLPDEAWAALGSFGDAAWSRTSPLLWPGSTTAPLGARRRASRLLLAGLGLGRKLRIRGPPDWWSELVLPFALDPQLWATGLDAAGLGCQGQLGEEERAD